MAELALSYALLTADAAEPFGTNSACLGLHHVMYTQLMLASAVNHRIPNISVVCDRSDRSHIAQQEVAHTQHEWSGACHRGGGDWGPVSKGGQGAGAHPAQVCAHEDGQQ